MTPAPSLRSALAAAAMALTLSACGPLNRPFQPGVKTLGGLQSPQLTDKFGVFVAGIDNAPAPTDDALSDAVVSALNDSGIPASRSSANRGSYLLIGRSLWQPEAAPGRAAVEIEWQVIDADGEAIATMGHRAFADKDQWTGGDPGVMRTIAEDLALQMADLLHGTGSADGGGGGGGGGGGAEALSYPPVSIADIDSAPGDGRRSLVAAMRRALRARGVPIADQGDGARVVRCTVEITRAGGRDKVEIRWVLLDAQGVEIGSIEQDNTIEAGSLDGAWGPIADTIAGGAADGLIDLLDRSPSGALGGAPGTASIGLQPPDALIQSAPNPPN